MRRHGQRIDLPRRDGFTLLELLVVIGLIGVITTWGYVLLFRVNSEWNDLRRRTELSDAADNMFETMKADFNALVSQELAGVPVAGAEDMHEVPQRTKYDDSFSLPIAGPEGQGLQRVRYYVERDEDRDLLTREATLLSAGETPAASNHLNPQVNVAYMRCEFGVATDHGFDWLRWNDWSRKHAAERPVALRVSMTLVNPEFPYIQVSRKAVFDVRVD